MYGNDTTSSSIIVQHKEEIHVLPFEHPPSIQVPELPAASRKKERAKSKHTVEIGQRKKKKMKN